jgi:hypothetical protein
MLSKEEQNFIRYWSDQRTRKKQFLRKFSIGLPLGAGIAVALIINFFSGWYKRADMDLRSNLSVVPVVLIAVVAIVVFITIFANYYRWDQNEQQYKELLSKSKKDDSAAS